MMMPKFMPNNFSCYTRNHPRTVLIEFIMRLYAIIQLRYCVGEQKNSGKWFIDSGCSNHMTYNKSLFSSHTSGHPSAVELENGNTAEVHGKVAAEIQISVNGKSLKCVLQNVLHVPDLGYQLLSVPTFDKSGLNTSLHSLRCWIMKYLKLLATGTMTKSLYELDLHSTTTESAFLAASTEGWDHRLAHIQPKTITEMANSTWVQVLQIRGSKNRVTCPGCKLGKAHRSAIPKKSLNRSTRLLELVDSDVNGPIRVPSLGASRYFVAFIDDFSRWTSLYSMKVKSETFSCFC